MYRKKAVIKIPEGFVFFGGGCGEGVLQDTSDLHPTDDPRRTLDSSGRLDLIRQLLSPSPLPLYDSSVYKVVIRLIGGT